MDRLGWAVCDWYEVHGYRFGLRTTSDAFAAWVRYALGAYLTEPTAEEEATYPTYSVVVEDGSRGEERVGKRYNILYLGTWDIARTLDLRFLARCLLRQIDSIGYGRRDDAVFLEAGVVEMAGSPSLVPTSLIRALCGARRRAEKRGLYAPGGAVTALDIQTGELIAPPMSIDLPSDALDRLDELVPGGVNGVRDRFPIEDGERRVAAAVINVGIGQPAPIMPTSRSDTVVDLMVNVKNMTLLGGLALRTVSATVTAAHTAAVSWSSTNELIDAIARAAEPALDRPGTRPTVAEIRPGVDEQRRSGP